MSHSCFEVEVEENVAHLRMCRPEALNSLNREFWRELPEIVRELDDAGAARVLVLSPRDATSPPAWISNSSPRNSAQTTGWRVDPGWVCGR